MIFMDKKIIKKKKFYSFGVLLQKLKDCSVGPPVFVIVIS